MRGVARVTAGVLAAVLALAGCTGGAGAAAVVDGRPIPVTDVDTVTRELVPFFQVQPRDVVRMLVVAPAFFDVAREHGLMASPDDALEWFEARGLQAPGEFSEASITVLQYATVVETFGQHEDAAELGGQVVEIVSGLDVSVSPRYGEFDPATTQVVATVPDWIVGAG